MAPLEGSESFAGLRADRDEHWLKPGPGQPSRPSFDNQKRSFDLPTRRNRELTRRTDISARDDSQTLLANVIAKGFADNGMSTPAGSNQSPSLTSSNNFINYCATVSAPLANGAQAKDGFCVPAPMGMIPSVNAMPSLKITFPRNGQTFQSDVAFSLNINVTNFDTGNFASSSLSFLAAPQQLGPSGHVLGHVNVVVEHLDTLEQISPSNPPNFALFKSLNDKDNDGLLTFALNSLGPGYYRAYAQFLTANFMPVLTPVIARGSLHDATYFTVSQGNTPPETGDGHPASATTQTMNPPPASDSSLAVSTTLAPALVVASYKNDGQSTPTAGQVASLTSTNNFINFCANSIITDGKQIKGSSCNPAPIGVIPPQAVPPSAKFVFPGNGNTIAADNSFTIQLAVNNFVDGKFTNPSTNYASAPQQIDSSGRIMGHAHVVIEQIQPNQTFPTDPQKFAFFAELDQPSKNGVLQTDVTKGLPPGLYRMSSTLVSANHQPIVVGVVQHGGIDDIVYFTVAGDPSSSSANTLSANPGTPSQTSSGGVVGSTSSPNPGSSSQPGSRSNISSGAIVGAILGPLLAIAIVVAAFLVYRRRRYQRQGLGAHTGFVPYDVSSATTAPMSSISTNIPPSIPPSSRGAITPYREERSTLHPPFGSRSRSEKSGTTEESTPSESGPSASGSTVALNRSRTQRTQRRDSATSIAPSYHTVDMDQRNDTRRSYN